ncbi:MAG: hypothetical protein IKN56_04970 [Clostridia bacterium]|nr:hypothetical protein [Clostridia bacterium]
MKKYVLRFLPEYNCSSLWYENDAAYDKYGVDSIEYSDVGLSSSLIQELEKFDESILNIIDWNDPGGPCPLSKSERMEIYNEGQRLLSLVRTELDDEFEIIDCLDWLKPKNE